MLDMRRLKVSGPSEKWLMKKILDLGDEQRKELSQELLNKALTWQPLDEFWSESFGE